MKNLTCVFLLFLLALLGCKLPGSLSSGNGNNGSSKGSTTVDPGLKGKVLDAFKKLRSAPFVTVKTERIGPDAATFVEQYSAADAGFSRKYVSGDGTEVIIVGKDNFSRMNSNWPWKKDTGSNSSAAETFFPRYDQLSKFIPEFTLSQEGDESISGKAGSVYLLIPPKPSPDLPSSIKVWIDKETGLILKILMERGKGDSSTESYDFATPVKIERPEIEKSK